MSHAPPSTAILIKHSAWARTSRAHPHPSPPEHSNIGSIIIGTFDFVLENEPCGLRICRARVSTAVLKTYTPAQSLLILCRLFSDRSHSVVQILQKQGTKYPTNPACLFVDTLYTMQNILKKTDELQSGSGQFWNRAI